MKRNARAFSINRRVLLSTAVLLSTPPLLRTASTLAQDASKPLTAWNDGPAKQAITEFVHATTDQSSPKFVQSEERIATFDQDGTLWVEDPMYRARMRGGLWEDSNLQPSSTYRTSPFEETKLKRFFKRFSPDE